MMELEQLKNTMEFQLLRPTSRMLVATYLEAGKRLTLTEEERQILAVRTAFPCKSDRVANVMRYRLFRSLRIMACLNRAAGKTEQESFMEQLYQVATSKRVDKLRLQAMRLYASLKGWDVKARGLAIVKAHKRQSQSMKALRVQRKIEREKEKESKPPVATEYDLSDFEGKGLPGSSVGEADEGNRGPEGVLDTD